MANVLTPEFRVSYPNVFKPKKNELNGKDEYGLVALFPKGTDLTMLKNAAKKAAEAKWGTDQSKWPKTLRMPFRDQGEKKKMVEGREVLPAGHEEGAIFINLKSSQKPGVVDQNVQAIISEADFYPGCWARASINAYAYDNAGNRGISFGLQNIQKTREGEALSGRMKAENEFAPISGGATAAGGSSSDLFG